MNKRPTFFQSNDRFTMRKTRAESRLLDLSSFPLPTSRLSEAVPIVASDGHCQPAAATANGDRAVAVTTLRCWRSVTRLTE